MAQAPRDQNQVPVLMGVSSADGVTPVTIYVDPTTHRVLTQASGASTKTVWVLDGGQVVRLGDGSTGSASIAGTRQGLRLITGATANSVADGQYAFASDAGLGNFLEADKNPFFSIGITANGVGDTNGQEAFFGIGNPTIAGTGFTMTASHIGFYWKRVAGASNLYASNAAGTTQTSTLLTTVAANDVLELICNVVTSGSSVNYYWAKNGGALSSAVNHTTNIYTGYKSDMARFALSNANVSTTSMTWYMTGFRYER